MPRLLLLLLCSVATVRRRGTHTHPTSPLPIGPWLSTPHINKTDTHFCGHAVISLRTWARPAQHMQPSGMA